MKLFCLRAIVQFVLSMGLLLTAIQASGSGQDLENHNKIMAAMDSLLLKNIDLKDATLSDIAQAFTKQSKNSDPQQQGLQFSAQVRPDDGYIKVTLKMQNISVRDALRELQKKTDIAYTVGETSIKIWHDSGDGLTSRSFVVPAGFFSIKDDRTLQSSYNVQPELMVRGILFPPGRSSIYKPSEKRLTVVEDSDQVEEIDYLLFKAIK